MKPVFKAPVFLAIILCFFFCGSPFALEVELLAQPNELEKLIKREDLIESVTLRADDYISKFENDEHSFSRDEIQEIVELAHLHYQKGYLLKATVLALLITMRESDIESQDIESLRKTYLLLVAILYQTGSYEDAAVNAYKYGDRSFFKQLVYNSIARGGIDLAKKFPGMTYASIEQDLSKHYRSGEGFLLAYLRLRIRLHATANMRVIEVSVIDEEKVRLTMREGDNGEFQIDISRFGLSTVLFLTGQFKDSIRAIEDVLRLNKSISPLLKVNLLSELLEAKAAISQDLANEKIASARENLDKLASELLQGFTPDLVIDGIVPTASDGVDQWIDVASRDGTSKGEAEIVKEP